MTKLIDSISTGVPKALVEVITLGRTLTKRAEDVLAYFDRPGTSNGPTEAMNGRLEHLRGSALGFRNLTNYKRPVKFSSFFCRYIIDSSYHPIIFNQLFHNLARKDSFWRIGYIYTTGINTFFT